MYRTTKINALNAATSTFTYDPIYELTKAGSPLNCVTSDNHELI